MRHVGRLEQRLRDWVTTRLAEKELERGETARLAAAIGEKDNEKWVSEYVRGKRHLSLDKLVLLMKHFGLNVFQVIDELPLPPADFETRQLLSAWESLGVGHPARGQALVSLQHVVKQLEKSGHLPRTRTLQPVAVTDPAPQERAAAPPASTRKGGRGR